MEDVVYGIGTYPPSCLSDTVERGAGGVRPYPIEYFFDIQYHLYRLHVIYLSDRGMRTKIFFQILPPSRLGQVPIVKS